MSVSTSQNDCAFLKYSAILLPSNLYWGWTQQKGWLFVFGMFVLIFIIILPYTSFNLNLTPKLTEIGKHVGPGENIL